MTVAALTNNADETSAAIKGIAAFNSLKAWLQTGCKCTFIPLTAQKTIIRFRTWPITIPSATDSIPIKTARISSMPIAITGTINCAAAGNKYWLWTFNIELDNTTAALNAMINAP